MTRIHFPRLPRCPLARQCLITILVLTAVGVASAAWAASAGRIPGQPWGRGTAADSCVVCHSLERGGPFRVAPNLFGIVGAEKARDRDWYGYSLALRQKGGTWTEGDLDQYLADASKFAPGTTKTIRINDAEERKQIIAFLKTLHR
jgi:cytochrome c